MMVSMNTPSFGGNTEKVAGTLVPATFGKGDKVWTLKILKGE